MLISLHKRGWPQLETNMIEHSCFIILQEKKSRFQTSLCARKCFSSLRWASVRGTLWFSSISAELRIRSLSSNQSALKLFCVTKQKTPKHTNHFPLSFCILHLRTCQAARLYQAVCCDCIMGGTHLTSAFGGAAWCMPWRPAGQCVIDRAVARRITMP